MNNCNELTATIFKNLNLNFDAYMGDTDYRDLTEAISLEGYWRNFSCEMGKFEYICSFDLEIAFLFFF